MRPTQENITRNLHFVLRIVGADQGLITQSLDGFPDQIIGRP